ncbi:hypothetical protein TRICI_003443 [Trichomonascus ciferrii]|uniref:ATP synthase subunit H, mitochondrial n=1 Tax=Trichomonascus ciferrii TaxID=44093 RepID=A0A642V412_9ASCO|nr:hypothetical protein TRICI_003443 [Trichomonascus ciferrii]
MLRTVTVHLIQDLYLKEVKGFKPTPKSAADAEANTKSWVPPKAPAAPSIEGSEADALSQYESQQVEVEADAPKTEGAEAPSASMDEWFVVEDTFAENNDAHH